MAGRSHRRPVWQPSKLSRLFRFLNDTLKRLTFTRIVLVLIILPFLIYLYREVTHNAVIIEPFSVPKRLEENGLTPDVIAYRIGDALRQIEIVTWTRAKKNNFITLHDEGSRPDVEIPGKIDLKTPPDLKDNFIALHDEGSQPDVEIPGTKIGLKTAVDISRSVLGIYPRHVSGYIVDPTSAGPSSAKPLTTVTVYVTQGRNRSPAVSFMVASDDIGALAQRTAEVVMRRVDPYILAVYQINHHEWDKAVEVILELVQNASADRSQKAGSYILWGNVLSEQRHYDEAIQRYEQAIALDPKNAAPYNNWGNVLSEQRHYDEAIQRYEQAIALDPTYAAPYYNWGSVLSDERKYAEAIALFQKAIELDPTYAPAYKGRGNVLSEQRNYDEAIDNYQKAIRLDPTYAIVYNDWGNALSKQTKYAEAIANYQKAAELDPKAAAPYYNWGVVLAEQKKYDEAVDKFQKAIDLEPKYAATYNNWGNVLSYLHKYAEAQEKFAKARELRGPQ